MAFERLDSVVKRVVSRVVNEVGESAIAVAHLRRKGPEAEAPGQVTELRQQEEKTDGASRERTNAALPMGRKQRIAPSSPIPVVASPKPAVRCFLVIEGGGGRPAEGGVRRAAYRADAGRERARELGLVVHAATR